ncbi:phosphate ABC transporter permease PstA [Natronococcus jeotgali]|uniref:Phosphate transport system permease protein PstA n=1 Tax=Natronococcus jeotgali DSM 18795 TaxID=1227498 RepID=L9XX93_9EURY|nr:phosphate ABC transporter permease PstA [Natronococcus jeotgali]ELY66395.1 phosphate ABC transporter inner membrane subunit PstA [Natronococcus jeotgali DSM 18795]
MATADDGTDRWFGADGQVSQLRGALFKASCLGATLLALALVFVFLLYVFNNAIRPATADTGWLLTVAGTVVLPAVALTAYYYRRDTRAGEVAYTALGVPVAATLLAGGVLIVFRHVVTPHEWLAFVVAAAVAYGVVAGHRRLRGDAAPGLERTAVVALVPLLAIVGVPGFGVDHQLRTPLLGQELFRLSVSVPELLPSLREVILAQPALPIAPASILLAFTVPIAAATARRVRNVRNRDRDAAVAGIGTVAVAGIGIVAAPAVGLPATAWVVATTVVGVPIGLYVESVLRRGEGVSGLAFPVVVGLGVALAFAVVEAVGFAGPDLWLDWSFLTGSHDTTPREAGIYPALVGSVMMLVVVAVAAFPVGVGAAIYLEEYAPTQGRRSSVVELIEINIANLAGVPSVVYGVLGLALFVRGIGMRAGIVVVGGLTIALLILPIIIVSAQEAIRSVPDSVRQASYGVGATRWQTVRSVVLPRAMPGILTGTILAFGRAIGETAPLLMIGAAAVVRVPPDTFTSLFSAMPRQIYSWSKLIDADFRYGVLAAGVVTLLVVLLMLNGSAILLRNKYQREG